jgi:hypothetical protein
MGAGSEWIEASSGSSENKGVGTCEACHISGRQEEDRCGDKGEMGEVPGREEEGDCVAPDSGLRFSDKHESPRPD